MMAKWQMLLFFRATYQKQNYIFESIKLKQITNDWTLLKHRCVCLGSNRRDATRQRVTSKQKIHFDFIQKLC